MTHGPTLLTTGAGVAASSCPIAEANRLLDEYKREKLAANKLPSPGRGTSGKNFRPRDEGRFRNHGRTSAGVFSRAFPHIIMGQQHGVPRYVAPVRRDARNVEMFDLSSDNMLLQRVHLTREEVEKNLKHKTGKNAPSTTQRLTQHQAEGRCSPPTCTTSKPFSPKIDVRGRDWIYECVDYGAERYRICGWEDEMNPDISHPFPTR